VAVVVGGFVFGVFCFVGWWFGLWFFWFLLWVWGGGFWWLECVLVLCVGGGFVHGVE